MPAHAQDSTFFTRRGIVVVIIIGLHVLAFWALATGLAQKVIEMVAPNIEADIVDEEIQEDEPPPPPPPELERPPVEVPPPEVTIELPMETNTTAIQDVTDKPPPAPPPPMVRAAGTPAKLKSALDPDSFYPPGAKRREEQGTPTVRACVGPNGRLVRDPVVAETSGYPELDAAAVALAKKSRFTPGTEGGQVLDESCLSFRVKFVIKNEN